MRTPPWQVGETRLGEKQAEWSERERKKEMKPTWALAKAMSFQLFAARAFRRAQPAGFKYLIAKIDIFWIWTVL